MDALLITTAYKYVAVVVMLAQVHDRADSLGLLGSYPLSRDDIRLVHVGEPRLMKGLSGAIDTKDYAFGFGTNGLWSITRINQSPNKPLREAQMEVAKMRSLIETNDCYPIAKQWLLAMQADVPNLESSHRPFVRQTIISSDTQRLGQKDEGIPLPVFDVCWGDQYLPAVKVRIFGPTKKVIALWVEDQSFIQRTNLPVKDVEKLLAISDLDFRQFSQKDRTNLLARHVGIISSNLFAFDSLATNLLFRGRSPTPQAKPKVQSQSKPSKVQPVQPVQKQDK
jgi:hypothetical protein